MNLRILHNGDIKTQNPHWHLKIWRDGLVRGEIIGRQTDYKAIQWIETRLEESDQMTLFAAAACLRGHFQSRNAHADDIWVELSHENAVQFVYAVPPLEQTDSNTAPLYRILNQILAPYV